MNSFPGLKREAIVGGVGVGVVTGEAERCWTRLFHVSTEPRPDTESAVIDTGVGGEGGSMAVSRSRSGRGEGKQGRGRGE